MKFLSHSILEASGFNFVFNEFTPLTPYGISLKKSLPIFMPGEEHKLQQHFLLLEKLIEDMKDKTSLYNELKLCFMKFKDISGTIRLCRNNAVLDEVEIFEIKNLCINIIEFQNLFESLNLKKLMSIEKLTDVKSVLELLDPEDKKLPTFFIYEGYSPKLKDIRSRKKDVEHRIFNSPPEELQELKSLRLSIVNEELQEELLIKEQLSYELHLLISDITDNLALIGELDILIARGNLALRYKGVKPELTKDLSIDISSAVNPFVEKLLKVKGKSFKELSIKLEGGSTVITGANMGGKTVALKTLVLNIALVHYGFFPFCKSIRLCLFNFIYFSSEDKQSLSKGLSSFGAEIMEINEVLALCNRQRGFIALDEFARGTNPKEGSILLRSLTSYLNSLNSIAVIATHYDGIAKEAKAHYQCVGLKKTDFNSLNEKIKNSRENSVDILQEYVDFTLEKVSASSDVPRDALNICRLLNFPEEILNKAVKLYEKGD